MISPLSGDVAEWGAIQKPTGSTRATIAKIAERTKQGARGRKLKPARQLEAPTPKDGAICLYQFQHGHANNALFLSLSRSVSSERFFYARGRILNSAGSVYE